MDNPRPEKVAVVDEVRAKLDAADAAVLTEYRGLSVSATEELRRGLRDAGGEYKIYKNTLVRIAARGLGLEIDDLLTGPTAIAFVQGDPVNVAKALRDFARTNPALVIKGGLLGQSLLDERGVTALADLEPREVILAQLAGALAAPMQQLAGLLEALPRNFAYGLKALIDQGGAPGAPADAPPAEQTSAGDTSGDRSASEAAAEAPAEPEATTGVPAPAEADAGEAPVPDASTVGEATPDPEVAVGTDETAAPAPSDPSTPPTDTNEAAETSVDTDKES